MSGPTWTDEECRALVDGRAQGLSFAAIGASLGRSKSACIGFLARCCADADAIPDATTKPENKNVNL